MISIREFRVRAIRVPMREPHRTASGTIAESPLVLTDILTGNDVTGHSIVFTYTTAALGPTADLIRNIGQTIVGEPLAPLDIADKLARRFRLLGTQGLVGMALAAIDMAAWDALARHLGLPLCELLGGFPKPVQAYGAVGYDGAAGSASVAEQWAAQGFKAVKAKIGYPTVREDLEVIKAIRSAVGNDVAIMVDYNQSLTPTEAMERIRILESEGLAWIEEPVLAHDYEGHARVARQAATPIQCGENWWGPQDFGHAIAARASDYAMLDAMKIGGVTGWMRAGAMAANAGLRVSSHLWPEISAHLLSVTPTAHWLEYCDWWNLVIASPLRIERGTAIAGSAPGSGVEWNEDGIARC
jgi:mandelate racemase